MDNLAKSGKFFYRREQLMTRPYPEYDYRMHQQRSWEEQLKSHSTTSLPSFYASQRMQQPRVSLPPTPRSSGQGMSGGMIGPGNGYYPAMPAGMASGHPLSQSFGPQGQVHGGGYGQQVMPMYSPNAMMQRGPPVVPGGPHSGPNSGSAGSSGNVGQERSQSRSTFNDDETSRVGFSSFGTAASSAPDSKNPSPPPPRTSSRNESATASSPSSSSATFHFFKPSNPATVGVNVGVGVGAVGSGAASSSAATADSKPRSAAIAPIGTRQTPGNIIIGPQNGDRSNSGGKGAPLPSPLQYGLAKNGESNGSDQWKNGSTSTWGNGKQNVGLDVWG